jgi:hypothetical protein
MPTGPDGLEELLGQLGITFGKQTVLYGSQAREFAERRANPFVTGAGGKVPPVLFEAPRGVSPTGFKSLIADDAAAQLPPNPISTSMEVIQRSVGGQKLDLEIRFPRPVYFTPARPNAVAYAGFLFSDPDSWNEADPFPTRERTPRFEPPKPDDPTAGTPDERRRGGFALGVAVETTLPPEWFDSRVQAAEAADQVAAGAQQATPLAVAAAGLTPADPFGQAANVPERTVRVVAIGQGGLFTGPDLSPAKENLLVNTCNWLLRRDERMPRDAGEPWRYPRVSLGEPGVRERNERLWFWGTLVALPGLFVFLGYVVLTARRYR